MMATATWTPTCWCDWPEPCCPDRSHDEHIRAYDYPDHEPSPEWNVPEPDIEEA